MTLLARVMGSTLQSTASVRLRVPPAATRNPLFRFEMAEHISHASMKHLMHLPHIRQNTCRFHSPVCPKPSQKHPSSPLERTPISPNPYLELLLEHRRCVVHVLVLHLRCPEGSKLRRISLHLGGSGEEAPGFGGVTVGGEGPSIPFFTLLKTAVPPGIKPGR